MNHWAVCHKCLGRGKKNIKLCKKARWRFQVAIKAFEQDKNAIRPQITQYRCDHCEGTGLVSAAHSPEVKASYPRVAIIGAGIGGVALAVACYHRGIPFDLYERDQSFDARSQGYGLTLQQASNAIKGLGLFLLKEGVHSTRHVVHDTEGKIISEWGVRTHSTIKEFPRRKNVHIPRQALRLALLEQLGSSNRVQWGHRLVGLKQNELTFQVDNEIKRANADLIVGADGIRSSLRSLIIREEITPLRYLGYIVILGICSLDALKGIESPLLDSSTVFQTVNGHERIYMMPYSKGKIMWQFSFPIPENEAKILSAQGSKALKEEAYRRTKWHLPIPQIVSATLSEQISGYPVYDRELLAPQQLKDAGSVTLIGDSAHPMSPFKGQGANQALLDALSLARKISTTPNWKERGIREAILAPFEEEMLARSASKVSTSAEAAEFLHSPYVLREGNNPKGRCFK